MKESRIRELIYLARCGDGDAYNEVYRLYHALACKLSADLLNTYYRYTGMSAKEMALYADEEFAKVINNYDERTKISVTSYFCLCIYRQIRRATSFDGNRYVYLDERLENGRCREEQVADPTPTYNPQLQNERRMQEEILKKSVASLNSERDAKIIAYYREGYSPSEIATLAKVPSVWVVYNVLYRTMNRLKQKHQRMMKARRM